MEETKTQSKLKKKKVGSKRNVKTGPPRKRALELESRKCITPQKRRIRVSR